AAVEAAEEAGGLSQPGTDIWGEAQRLAAAGLIEAGRSADGEARAAWALSIESKAESLGEPLARPPTGPDAASGPSAAAVFAPPEGTRALSLPMRATLLAVRVRGLIDLGRPVEAQGVANAALEAARASGGVDAIIRALDAGLIAKFHVADVSG